MSTIDTAFRRQDAEFALRMGLADAIPHNLGKGEQYEDEVKALLSAILPQDTLVRSAFLDTADPTERKQVDLAVIGADLPPLITRESRIVLAPEWALATGEVKLGLRTDQRDNVLDTARRIHAFLPDSETPTPFLLVAGRPNTKETTLATWIGSISAQCPRLWPSAHVFRADGQSSTLVTVSSSTPLLAFEASTRAPLHGVMEISDRDLSPTAALWIILRAGLQVRSPRSTMSYDSMRTELHRLTRDEPLSVQLHRNGGHEEVEVTLHLREGAALGLVPTTVPGDDDSRPVPAVDAATVAPLITDRPVMLISQGPWIDEPATWDETPWGGGVEYRKGHGYRPGMPDHDLLQSARVFWRFNPRSPTWEGIEHAVVVHAGVTRAVLSIDRWIGPFWGRYGFQGRVLRDQQLLDELVGKAVRGRQNPVSRWWGPSA